MAKAEASCANRTRYRLIRSRTTHGTSSCQGKRWLPLSGEDKLTLGILMLFIAVAFSLELYFVMHYRDINTQQHLFARGFQIYAAGDNAYYGHGNIYVPFALETINVFFTQVLNVALIWAIMKRRAYRYPLQLAVSAYMSYSLIFYFWLAHVSGYPGMPERNAWGVFIFVTPNLPWLIGNFYLAYRAFVVIQRRFSEWSGREVGETTNDPILTSDSRGPPGQPTNDALRHR